MPLRRRRNDKAPQVTTQQEQTPGLDFHPVVKARLPAFLVVGPADDQAVVTGAEKQEIDVGEVDFEPCVRRPVTAAAEEQPAMSDGVLPNREIPVGSEPADSGVTSPIQCLPVRVSGPSEPLCPHPGAERRVAGEAKVNDSSPLHRHF